MHPHELDRIESEWEADDVREELAAERARRRPNIEEQDGWNAFDPFDGLLAEESPGPHDRHQPLTARDKSNERYRAKRQKRETRRTRRESARVRTEL